MGTKHFKYGKTMENLDADYEFETYETSYNFVDEEASQALPWSLTNFCSVHLASSYIVPLITQLFGPLYAQLMMLRTVSILGIRYWHLQVPS